MVDPADRDDIRATLANHDGDAYARLIRRHQQTVATRMRASPATAPRSRNSPKTSSSRPTSPSPATAATPPSTTGSPSSPPASATATGSAAHRTPTTPLTGAERAPTPPDASDHELDAVLRQLPPRHRLVITLLYLEDRSVAEAARLTGWSQTMVKVQAFRAAQTEEDHAAQHHRRPPVNERDWLKSLDRPAAAARVDVVTLRPRRPPPHRAGRPPRPVPARSSPSPPASPPSSSHRSPRPNSTPLPPTPSAPSPPPGPW